MQKDNKSPVFLRFSNKKKEKQAAHYKYKLDFFLLTKAIKVYPTQKVLNETL